jgi:hypothetical protein
MKVDAFPPASDFKKVIAEGFVLRVIKDFVDFSQSLQGEDPHVVLALFWLRWKRDQGLLLGDDALHRHAFPETKMLACVQLEDCPEALALQLLADEHPSCYGAIHTLQRRFVSLISPAVDASIAGRYQELYAEKNPTMAELMKGHAPSPSEESVGQ